MIQIKNLCKLESSEWPEGTAGELLKKLNDPAVDPSDRLMAAEMAGDLVVVNDPMAEALLAIVNNRDETDALREKAVISLAPALEHGDLFEFEDPDDIVLSERVFRKVQKSLQDIYENEDVPKDVRRKTLETAVRAPLAWHQKAVEASFKADDEDWQMTAVYCMRYCRGFNVQILDAIERPHPGIHYEAVLAAGIWGVEKAWPHIAKLLDPKNEDEPLLLAAIQATSGFSQSEATDSLKGLLGSKNDNIVVAVKEALSMMDPGLSGEALGTGDDKISL